MNSGFFDIAKKIILVLMIAAIGVMAALLFTGCKTQASYINNEPIACYNSRYLAREGISSDTLANACADADKRNWCVKILKESPDTFKDFNDCWRTGK